MKKKTNNHLLNVKNVSFGYIHIVLSLRLRIRTMYYYIVSMHRNVLFMVKSHEVYTWPLTSRIVNTFIQNISDLGKQNTTMLET